MRSPAHAASAALNQMQRPSNGAILASVLFSTALAAFAVGAWMGQRCDLQRQHTANTVTLPREFVGRVLPQDMPGAPARRVPEDSPAATDPWDSGTQRDTPGELQEPTQFAPAFPENRSPGGHSDQTTMQTLREEVLFLRRQVRDLRRVYGITYCSLHGVGPSGGFCVPPNATSQAGKVSGTLMDPEMCAALGGLLAGARVADFGAGLGQYGKCLGPVVREYVPYDGGEGVEEATAGAVRFLDLAVPSWLGTMYDWVISLEVGEHIPADREDDFIRNVLRHAARGVVLSWAVPGQAGQHHVNLRSNSHVASRVSELGGGRFVLNVSASATLRAASSFYWFKNTIMVFDVVK